MTLKQINKAFFLGAVAAAAILVVYTAFSVRSAIKLADLLIMEQASSLTNAAIIAQDLFLIQKELSRFVNNLNQTESFRSQITVLVNDKMIASVGETAGISILSPTVSKSFELAGGQGKSFQVVAIVDPTRIVFRALVILLALFTMIGLVAFFIRRLINRSLLVLTEPLMDLISQIGAMSLNLTEPFDRKLKLTPTSVKEVASLNSAIESFLSQIKSLQDKLGKTQADKGRVEVAKQVAHDIRSPLSALNMVMGTLKDLPEEKRILIRGATQRINDIANDLLRKSSSAQGVEQSNRKDWQSPLEQISSPMTVEFVPALVDVLVSEKRMQFREHFGLEIDVDLKDSFGAFAQISPPEVKRVISNLINNAVEAFDKNQGKIVVGVKRLEDKKQLEISVKDNGKGIPEHILTKLGKQNISYGKEGTQSGCGIGVLHAKNAIAAFGGELQIDSVVGKGTAIRIVLPLATTPAWFADRIDLTNKQRLVSLDDDSSIHQIWSGRLQSLGLNKIEHIKINSAEIFEKFVYDNMSQMLKTIFLVDFELLNQSKTGLDLIEELGLDRHAILVTSRYEEQGIQERSSKIGLKILPKSLAGFVPVTMAAAKIRYDLCLIDDDTQLIHPVWAAVAKTKGLKIKMFANPQEFLSAVDSIDRLTPIYVDVSLGDGISGAEFAWEIHRLEFVDINLATGYGADSIDKPPFIRKVSGKDFPDLLEL